MIGCEPVETMSPDQFMVFFGVATDTLAEIYLRRRDGDASEMNDARLEIRGPFCSIAKTLKTTTLFQRTCDPAVWRARIVDPCFWSPDYPACYRICIQLGAQTIEFRCGIRRFGVKDGQFWLNGKRWVLRAAHQDSRRETLLQQWREARLAMLVDDPLDSLLDRAAELGVMLIINLEVRYLPDRLRQVSQSPAVVMAIVPPETTLEECRAQAPNLLIAKRFAADASETSPQDVDVILCQTKGSESSALLGCNSIPVVAVRHDDRWADLTAARAACDALQRDLAPRFDLSGYLV